MKKTCAKLTLLVLCLSLMLPAGAVAFADTGGAQASSRADAVYVGDSYDSGIAPRTRGNCTDSYTRAWCNSHGFANNRPVPHAVHLNARERRCYNQMLISSAAAVAGLAWSGPGGALIATASGAFTLWNCLF